jgi:hypothetical protein
MGLINELARLTTLRATTPPDRSSDAPSALPRRAPKPNTDSAQISTTARQLAEGTADAKADALTPTIDLLNRLTDASSSYSPYGAHPKPER